MTRTNDEAKVFDLRCERNGRMENEVCFLARESIKRLVIWLKEGIQRQQQEAQALHNVGVS